MRNVFEYIDDVHLEHHGIKGQKWGVRRFQNPDGSRTSEGKKRYSNDYTSKDLKKDLDNAMKHKSSFDQKGSFDKKAFMEQQDRLQRIREKTPELIKKVEAAKSLAKKLDDIDDTSDDAEDVIDDITKKVNAIAKDYLRTYDKLLKSNTGSGFDENDFLKYEVDEDFWLQIPNYGY